MSRTKRARKRPDDGEPSWPGPEESLAKREHIYGGTARHQVWDYLVRQLPA